MLLETVVFCLVLLGVLQLALFFYGLGKVGKLSKQIQAQEGFSTELVTKLTWIEKNQERLEKLYREEAQKSRDQEQGNSRELRKEITESVRQMGDSVWQQMKVIADLQKSQLEHFSAQLSKLTDSNEKRLDALRITLEQKLTQLQDANTKKLEEMRITVDEKLQGTLEKRLGESFKVVSERLEQVHKGLGEMQTLAIGVGDLKKVLTNVKTRGTWGEIQLGSLLEQMLTPDQYSKNVSIKKNSDEQVEFAIRLPGREDNGSTVWLPIDSKFPQEDYQRLLDAQEKANGVEAEEAAKQLEIQLKKSARDIRDKYISPPSSTDFAILFLPIESLFAEILRRPGLADQIQRDYRVTIAGPTTLAALLNSLQMGFRTLSIQKRSSEVWKVLGAVKTEFSKFGEILNKVEKKLQEAQNTIVEAGSKTRNIERKLKAVEELPASEAASLLILGPEVSE